jgi:hypothetical protein
MSKDNRICGVFMYRLSYTKLTLKVKKEEEKTYNAVLMEFILREFNEKRFIATKINKATRNGTSVKFEAIEDYQRAKERLFEIAKELNIKLEEKERSKENV